MSNAGGPARRHWTWEVNMSNAGGPASWKGLPHWTYARRRREKTFVCEELRPCIGCQESSGIGPVSPHVQCGSPNQLETAPALDVGGPDVQCGRSNQEALDLGGQHVQCGRPSQLERAPALDQRQKKKGKDLRVRRIAALHWMSRALALVL